MATATISLTAPQQAIHNSPARFKVVAAGRRLGKTTYAALECLMQALATENSFGDPLGPDAEVVYFGVDREQAKRNVWNMLKEFSKDMNVYVKAHENNCVLTVNNGINDVRIRLLGMDAPDKARGMKLRFIVMDEYADMPEEAWSEVIRPALMDSRGGALFIGTPKGKNHFYELFGKALTGEAGPEWEAFSFQSHDNSTLHRGELDQMADDYSRGSPELYSQEIEGKFISKGGALFSHDDFPIDPNEPPGGSYYISVDLAGFGKESAKRTSRIKKLDDTAICIAKSYETVDKNGKEDIGWWVKEIQHGQWGVEETAVRIVEAYQSVRAQKVGIEKGALLNAVAPYLDTVMTQKNCWMTVEALTHGNQRKYDRIQWALQGRAKRGLITLNEGYWTAKLLEQAVDFPSRLTHDDLLDALAYQDQIADYTNWDISDQLQEWEPLDPYAGY